MKWKNIIIVISSMFFLISLIIYRNIVVDSVMDSMNIWVNSLLPSLFPCFIVSDILIHYDIIDYIPNFIKNIFKYLFNVSDNGLMVILLSMLSGFPSNGRNIKTMYLDKLITKEEAEHLLLFTHFSNFSFILGSVSVMLNNDMIGIYILISHYLSNIIIGILFRNKNNSIYEYNNVKNTNNKHLGKILATSIKKSIDSILGIFGVLTVFLIISTITINFFSLSNCNSLFIKSVLEITSGIRELSKYNLNSKYLLIICSCILSFGGLSVHMQVINELDGTNISYKNFFIGRVMQTLLSLIISYVISLFAF